MGQTTSCSGSFKQQQLHGAIREGDLQLVTKIVEKDPQLVNKAHFYRKLTPLQIAALLGELDLIL